MRLLLDLLAVSSEEACDDEPWCCSTLDLRRDMKVHLPGDLESFNSVTGLTGVTGVPSSEFAASLSSKVAALSFATSSAAEALSLPVEDRSPSLILELLLKAVDHIQSRGAQKGDNSRAANFPWLSRVLRSLISGITVIRIPLGRARGKKGCEAAQ